MDQSGNAIIDESQMGLLLYNGGTVCDDNFSDNSANAICKVMGYDQFILSTNRKTWSIKDSYAIRLDNVVCSNDDWDSCTYGTTHNCNHNEDIFLQCGDATMIGNSAVPLSLI